MPFERNASDCSSRPRGADRDQPCWSCRSTGLRSRHQRAPRRIGERAAYFAHRREFVPTKSAYRHQFPQDDRRSSPTRILAEVETREGVFRFVVASISHRALAAAQFLKELIVYERHIILARSVIRRSCCEVTLASVAARTRVRVYSTALSVVCVRLHLGAPLFR
jgi:hypothetical protein